MMKNYDVVVVGGGPAGVSQIVAHHRRYSANIGVPALLDSDAVTDSDVVMVCDYGNAGAIVQSYRVLFELLVGGALIGDQPAEQSASGRASHLLRTRTPGASRYRQTCEAAKCRATAGIGFGLHLLDTLHHTVLDAHRGTGACTAARLTGRRHNASSDYCGHYCIYSHLASRTWLVFRYHFCRFGTEIREL